MKVRLILRFAYKQKRMYVGISVRRLHLLKGTGNCLMGEG